MNKWGVIFTAIALIVLGILSCDPRFALAENSVGPTNLIVCNQIAVQAVGVNSSTKMISGSAGKNLVICGWDVSNTGATGTFTFTSGTGSNCGTGSATVIPALNITNTAPAVDVQQYARFGVGTPAAPLDFCITPSVTTIAAVVFFAQF